MHRAAVQQAGAVAIPGADKAQNGAAITGSSNGPGAAAAASHQQRHLPAPAFGSSPNLQALALDAATEPSFEPRTFQEITVVSADQPKLLSRLSEVMVRSQPCQLNTLCATATRTHARVLARQRSAHDATSQPLR